MEMVGSLQNRMMERAGSVEPEVGMAATITQWSDRLAATVVEVRRFKSGYRKGQVCGVVVQRDRATLVSGSAQACGQKYEYARDPEGARYEFKRGDNGRYTASGRSYGLFLGARREYRDPSF